MVFNGASNLLGRCHLCTSSKLISTLGMRIEPWKKYLIPRTCGTRLCIWKKCMIICCRCCREDLPILHLIKGSGAVGADCGVRIDKLGVSIEIRVLFWPKSDRCTYFGVTRWSCDGIVSNSILPHSDEFELYVQERIPILFEDDFDANDNHFILGL
jgi:hypothetical protein